MEQADASLAKLSDLAEPVPEIPDKWELLPAFLRAKGFIKQHIDSYNHFVKVEMGQIVRAETARLLRSEVDPKFFLEFLDCRVGQPRLMSGSQSLKLTPMQCRQRDMTYSAPILVDMEYYQGGRVIRRMREEIGRMPVMLKSCACWMWESTEEQVIKLGECPRDPGGYFVVKGSEKAILMQEQISKNRIIIEKDFKKCLCATVSSVTNENKSRTQVVWKNQRAYLRHNSFVDDIPVVIALKAMGFETDQEILQMIGTSKHHAECIHLSMQESIELRITTQRQALLYLGRRVRQRSWIKEEVKKDSETLIDEGLDMLHRVILSHLPSEGDDFRAKGRYICLMIRRVFNAIAGLIVLDDKDYYGNKRLELAGQLMALMFEDKFRTWRDEYKKRIDEALKRHMARKSSSTKMTAFDDYPDVVREKPGDTITRGMQQALSTGNWTIKRFRMEKSGVAQVLSRFSYVAALGMMTRLVAGVEKGMKLAQPRWLQPSQWGMLCPCDTPEGEGIGIVKNLSLMTQVTTDENDTPLKRMAFILGVEDGNCLTGEELYDTGTYLIFLNGSMLGVHRRPTQFMLNWKRLRRCGKIGGFVSIYVDESHQAIYIASDGGRLCRPLIIVEGRVPRLKAKHVVMVRNGELNFFDFLRNGVLEWIDVNEENNTVTALKESDITEETTHLEIDALTIMGVVSGLVPYPHHNQSPRNTYQCAMGKQAMGVMSYNQFNRVDNVLYLLVYPQRQLCKSKTIELAGLDKLPAGHAASVAVMSYSGYDIEDALIMNRGAIDRGFGRCYVIKRYAVELKKYGGTADRALPPPPPKMVGSGRNAKAKVDYRYEVLEGDGVARVGALLSQDQIYCNKGVPVQTDTGGVTGKQVFQPQPAKYKTPVPSFVDRVILTENAEDNVLYKFIFRQTRPPEYGDKFSSRHGQKGVVGCIVPPEDFPFAESGWSPDMIMNPHGFPSRMTVGKMIELIAGKSSLFDGKLKYGTAFGGTKVKDIAQVLCGAGFHYSGKDYLTSGITGEALQTYVFNGPIFYQKLKHMVQDKIHARGIGPRQLMTRQPTEGRAKMGGLRLGEMERDCLVAYGGSNMILERLMLSSDAFKTDVCSRCGLLGYNNYCPYCKTSDDVASITLPYACKLLFQELQAMNVTPKLKLSEIQ
ncbi:DNA-directed RNA polymerase beta subunit [Gregarina niphandrodes]|uniref:DNA-directed RNA polymerase subunit beta n=1 Tax=Gregarina niphandrodes TaxID=110365 RepID=A0A023B170_GRENI|nr:DNA-directed RNA polymerase beta subunit [Gregarina niphandrodes]EZG46753.1 DNA-directed RNA polymerase beta subunit [Gregarina niphandrodes]|eukprot:XP_011132262.1 DNA-directed RNA polymerase beta subunit [Gregarina niphandrodes]